MKSCAIDEDRGRFAVLLGSLERWVEMLMSVKLSGPTEPLWTVKVG